MKQITKDYLEDAPTSALLKHQDVEAAYYDDDQTQDNFVAALHEVLDDQELQELHETLHGLYDQIEGHIEDTIYTLDFQITDLKKLKESYKQQISWAEDVMDGKYDEEDEETT